MAATVLGFIREQNPTASSRSSTMTGVLEGETTIGEVFGNRNQIESGRHTLLFLVGVAQLLQSTVDLLGGPAPMFAGLFEDSLRDEAIPVRELTERLVSRRLDAGGLITDLGDLWAGRKR